jgi:hypothetical protein
MPSWLRFALAFTTIMNIFGGFAFSPWGRFIQRWAGFPNAPDLYLWIVASFIFGMGMLYGWMTFKNIPNRLVIAFACYGKITFSLILAHASLTQTAPALIGLSGIPDCILGILFGVWLFTTREHTP